MSRALGPHGEVPPIQDPFTYEFLPMRVRFGEGAAAQLPAELERLGAQRVLVVAGARHRPLVDDLRGRRPQGRWDVIDDIRQHVPAGLAAGARALAADRETDTVVAVGGGSAIGLAKAIARDRPVRIVAVPTTYSGSEMTPVWGMTTADGKQTGRDPGVLPAVVVYDPGLTRSMPPGLAAASGLNALAHAVEALYAPGRNPITDLVAVASLARLASGLPGVVRGSEDPDVWSQALYGACLGGLALGQAGTSFHHKICHVLGGRFDLPHAETHAALLPHSVRLAAERFPEAGAAIAHALGVADAASGVADLARQLRAPASLRGLGLTQEALDTAVEEAEALLAASDIDLPEGASRALLHAAYGASADEGV